MNPAVSVFRSLLVPKLPVSTVDSKSSGLPSYMDPQNALLSLSPELRNHIYEYTLLSDLPARSIKGVDAIPIKRVQSTSRSTPSVLSLLQACRQIHHEAEGIFFSQTLESHASDLARSLSNGYHGFLDTACRARSEAVRHIIVSIKNVEQITQTLKHLPVCTKIQTIDFAMDVRAIYIDREYEVFRSERWHLKNRLRRVPETLRHVNLLLNMLGRLSLKYDGKDGPERFREKVRGWEEDLQGLLCDERKRRDL